MADLESKEKNENKKAKGEVFTLKASCKIGDKEYKKGDQIEIKSPKGIEFMKTKRLID